VGSKMSGTQAVILFYFGVFGFVLNVYTLLSRPFAPRYLATILAVAFDVACIYVGVRFKYLIATAPARVEQLV
jgi:hypothetical protein